MCPLQRHCKPLFEHVSIQNEINMHALRVDVLSARSDGSENAMHHLVCVVEQKDWHPATARKLLSVTPADRASCIDGAPE